jgi:hypothetical protein
MELTVITTSVLLSIGLGLAGAHAMLSTAMFLMARSVVGGNGGNAGNGDDRTLRHAAGGRNVNRP